MFEHQNNEKIYKTNKKIYLITFINNHYVGGCEKFGGSSVATMMICFVRHFL